VSVDDDAVKGDSDAPVTIIEFSDFECPFCTRFYQNTLSQIDEKYIKTGKVKFVYRDFPLNIHANAQKAGEAAECAGEQGKFWEMHDKLFDDGVSGGVDSFKQYASDLGLDTTKFNECLDSDKMASEVQKDFSDGSAAGVSGTPAFFINGIFISGAQPFEAFEQVIEAELAK
jgi:protein-disulfide isomerase